PSSPRPQISPHFRRPAVAPSARSADPYRTPPPPLAHTSEFLLRTPLSLPDCPASSPPPPTPELIEFLHYRKYGVKSSSPAAIQSASRPYAKSGNERLTNRQTSPVDPHIPRLRENPSTSTAAARAVQRVAPIPKIPPPTRKTLLIKQPLM